MEAGGDQEITRGVVAFCSHDFLRELKGGSNSCRGLHEGPSCGPAAWLVAQDRPEVHFLQLRPAPQVHRII